MIDVLKPIRKRDLAGTVIAGCSTRQPIWHRISTGQTWLRRTGRLAVS
jgi:hypothetical protein